MQRNKILRILAITAAILAVPLLAMQFSDEVDWGLEDFVAIGLLLIVAGLIYEHLASKVDSQGKKLAIGMAVLVCVLVMWAQLAVGLIS